MERTVEALAREVGGSVVGDGAVPIRGLAGLKDARADELSFVASAEFLRFVPGTRAAALLVDESFALDTALPLIRVADPLAAMEKLVPHFRVDESPAPGVDPTAVVAADAALGRDVVIGAGATVGRGATLGDRAVLHPGVHVGPGCSIGADCVLHAQVVVRARAILGARVVLHAGTVVGADGFGYRSTNAGHQKLEHVGTVVIEDDVEIGANCVVDRARFGRTVVGAGTKIDNLCQVAHNVQLGRGCLLAAQVGVSGSTVLGDGVVVGGQAGFSQNLDVGAGTMVSARAGVIKDHPAGSVLYGNPAGDRTVKKREVVALRRLPGLFERLRRLEAARASERGPSS